MSLVDIIIPSFTNPEYAVPCVRSILRDYDGSDLFHIYLVNNGDANHARHFPDHPAMTVIQQPENRGWEGGLKAGLEYSKAPYVMFLNDDTFIPQSSTGWIRSLLRHFLDPECGAVGPSSNVVMGSQQIFIETPPIVQVKFLIGLCLLLKRSDLDAAGGIDSSLPGGDDLDLSIRLRDLGKTLVCDRTIFVYHHGFKTGQKVHGDDWNSVRMLEATNHAIIRKHGLRKFLDLWKPVYANPDEEGKLIASMISRNEKVVDLGCGTRRTVPWAIGVDQLPKGTPVPNVFPPGNSVADIVADVTGPLPFEPESQDVVVARHVIEHVENIEETLKHWAQILKHGGHLVLAVPNDNMGDTLHMDPDHKHAYTPESMTKILEAQGWKTKGIFDPKNKVSFVGVWEKNGFH